MAAATRSVPPAAARLAAKALRRFVFDPTLPWERQRARFDRLTSAGALPPGTEVATERLGGVPVERITAPGSDPRRIVVHLHGGGYTVGTPAAARGWAAALAAAAGVTVVLPDYRLAPEAPFPAGLDDATAVWDALTGDTTGDTTGDGPRPAVAVGGDSAGGGLAVALCTRLRDADRAGPAALLLISPWLDLTVDRAADRALLGRDPLLTPAWLARAADAYAAGTDLADPQLSPVLGALHGLPPALVQAGADDILIGDSLRFTAGVQASGGTAELSIGNGLWHDFPLQAGMLAAADRGIRQTTRFLGRHLPAT